MKLNQQISFQKQAKLWLSGKKRLKRFSSHQVLHETKSFFFDCAIFGFVESMKWIIFNLFILLFYFVQSMHCECCNYTYLYFETQGIDLQKRKYYECEDFGGTDNINSYTLKPYVTPKWRRSCRIAVCNDGQPPVNDFCGYGSCDGLGCNCVGGCIDGIGAVESFKFMHGSRVLNIGTKFEFIAIATN